MVQEPPDGKQKTCELCGAEIATARLDAMPGVRTCVACQDKLDRRIWDAAWDQPGLEDPSRGGLVQGTGDEVVFQVQDNRVVVGDWSGDLVALVFRGDELRSQMMAGQKAQARALVQALSAEEQAALVALDENPEEVLSLTGMDEKGKPAYSPRVVDMLPGEMLAEMVAPKTEYLKYNTQLIRAMSPKTFRRAVEDTLAPIDHKEMRGQVGWEWLEALATLGDRDKMAALLRAVDPALLEEAIIGRLDQLDLHGVISFGGFSVSRFRLFSEEGSGAVAPSSFVQDKQTAEVLDALYDAAPDLLGHLVRGAWERAGGS